MSELYHHQIKGAHWGERNGPPWPLDPEDHTAEQIRKNPEIRAQLKAAKKAAKAEFRIARFKAKVDRHADRQLRKGKDDPMRKKASLMSEEELNAAIKRLDLEKRYLSLQKELHPEIKKRESMVKGMVSSALKNIGAQGLTAIFGELWNKVAENSGHPEFTVNPKKGQKDK